MAQRITSSTLPDDVRALFEIVGDIPGGPRLALPHYGIAVVDFSRLSIADAELLLAAHFPHIRRRAPAVEKKKVG